MTQRYLVQYGSISNYIVQDSKDNHKIVFSSMSKSECIKRSQELNGFEPADGNEDTYVKQVLKERDKECS